MFSLKWTSRAFIALMLSLSILAPSLMAYDDVAGDSPYFYAIEYLRKNDVFKTTKLFKPDSIVTRAEYISYLVKLNSPKFKRPASIKLPYSDTLDSAWYAPYLVEAVRVGILTGKEQKMQPGQNITLLDALELLFHSRSIPIPRRYVGEMPYRDLAKNTQAQAMVMRAQELGIVQPEKQDFFGLYRKISRAEAAKMIYKMDLVDLRDPSNAVSATNDTQLQRVENAWKLVQSNYVDKDKLDSKKLADTAIKAMVDTLQDPYSVFMDETENQALSDEIGGQFEGIGAYVEMKENKDIAVVSPIKDSPAFLAGVKAGDIIRKVNDFDTKGATLQETVKQIKGPKGTTVKLTLERNGQTIVLDVMRDVVNVHSLEYEVVGNGKIMHIHLMTFSQNLVKDFNDVVDIIRKNTEIKGVILDVRNNPGGLLDAAVGILSAILPADSVAVNIKYSYFNFTQYTAGNGPLAGYPMVVLANKGSASASEIVAGALKDYGVAKIIGETTFGKGTVQEVNYLGDGSSVKLTVAKWLTPLGNSIQKTGIAPDIEVAAGSNGTDPQMDRALAEIGKLIH